LADGLGAIHLSRPLGRLGHIEKHDYSVPDNRSHPVSASRGNRISPGNMHRYLEHRNLSDALEKLYEPGDRVNLLFEGYRVLPWTSDQSRVKFTRKTGFCRLHRSLQEREA